jgi:hypothetical protein
VERNSAANQTKQLTFGYKICKPFTPETSTEGQLSFANELRMTIFLRQLLESWDRVFNIGINAKKDVICQNIASEWQEYLKDIEVTILAASSEVEGDLQALISALRNTEEEIGEMVKSTLGSIAKGARAVHRKILNSIKLQMIEIFIDVLGITGTPQSKEI